MIQDPITIQQLRGLRTLTRNYGALRGLQVVPCGIFLLALGAFEAGWLRLPDTLAEAGLLLASLGFGVSLVIYQIIGRYYDHRFGRVKRVQDNPLDIIILLLACCVLFMAGTRIDIAAILPISATGLALALWFLFIWWRTDAFRVHILVIALLTGLVSLLPLGGFPSIGKSFLPGHGGYVLALGLFYTIGGLCDHCLLMHRLRQRQWSFYDQTV